MKPEVIEKYVCPECAELHDHESEANLCCPRDIESVYLCSICDEKFDRLTDAEKHLKTPHGNSELTIEEKYFEHLVFDVKPTLGQWAFEYELENA